MDFQANFEELESTGKTLISKASEYNSEVNAIYKQIDELQQGWQGADNQAFGAQVNTYKEPMLKLGSAIEESGQFLIQVSNVIQDTQNKISDAARNI